MSERRFVVDTIVLVSAALSREGAARRAVRSMLEHGSLLASASTFTELVTVLHRPKFERYLRAADRDEYLSLIQARSHFVESRERIAVCRDPDDDKFLEAENIEARPVRKPMPLQPAYEQYEYVGCGVADRLFERGLCLPLGSALTREEQRRVIGVVRRVYETRVGVVT